MTDMKRHGLVMVGILVSMLVVRAIFPHFFEGVGDGLMTGLQNIKSFVRGQ